VSEILAGMHAKGALIICDPVMADNGKLYPAFPDNFPDGMRSLCEQADIILPNLTEACLMLGIEYKPGGQTREYVEQVLHGLARLPRKTAVLTGVSFEENKLGAAAIDVATGEISYTMTERVPHMYHGTGDVFASAFVAAHVAGKPSGDALAIAARFTADAVARTLAAGSDDRFGVNFEAGLLSLAQAAAE
jgi:pyridoxine kinase